MFSSCCCGNVKKTQKVKEKPGKGDVMDLDNIDLLKLNVENLKCSKEGRHHGMEEKNDENNSNKILEFNKQPNHDDVNLTGENVDNIGNIVDAKKIINDEQKNNEESKTTTGVVIDEKKITVSNPKKQMTPLPSLSELTAENHVLIARTSASATGTTSLVTNEIGIPIIINNSIDDLPRKSSLKKRVNIVIPKDEIVNQIHDLNDDDDVFSDSIPSPLPRGNMCTPYPRKGSMPGYVALPDWFNTEERELSGIIEPPNTPIGRDELALKRHRFFIDLLDSTQEASEPRVRFDPFGPFVSVADDSYDTDCDPSSNSNRAVTSAELEQLTNRLERLLDRLERTVLARELKFAGEALNFNLKETDRQLCSKKAADKLEKDNLQKVFTAKLEQRITELENNINKSEEEREIPTVVSQIVLDKGVNEVNTIGNMSVNGYEDIITGYLNQFLSLSSKIGGDVATIAELVKKAFNAQFEYIKMASTSAQPPQNKQMELLKPTSDQITAIQNFREKNRTSPFFNHLSAISESIPALGWVCVAPTPGPHVKEMNDAGQFYTNRVLKDWKEKDATHAEWAKAWVQTLSELQKFIKQYHTTGLVWSGKGQVSAGAVPPPPPPGCPPPPPMALMADMSIDAGGDERNALFAQINQGENITKSLKKVTPDMQTHKNTSLRSGPAPYVNSAPQPYKPAVAAKPVTAAKAPEVKPPVFNRDGKKWLIEYQKSNNGLKVEGAEMNNVVYMFRCENSTLTVTGKINSIVIDSCKKCSILFDSLVSSIEFVNCQSVQMQVLGKVPTISIDKTDGCQMYLSKDSLAVEIVSSKSSEMNVLIPTSGGDYTEQPIPEQYKTVIKGNSLNTTCVESLG